MEKLEQCSDVANIPDSEKYFTDFFHDAGIMAETFVAFANKPTAESKFLYIYDLFKTRDLLPTNLTSRRHKNNKNACTIRNKGTRFFENRLYAKALLEYNLSVMNASVGSVDYALALANRSAALYHLEEYDACITDIHLALATKYPNEKYYKLYEREVKCLGKLGRITQAKFKFKEFLLHLSQTVMTVKKKKDMKVRLELFLNKLNMEKNSVDDEKIKIELLGGPNKSIPALSKFVKLKYSESMGRCLVVTSNVNPGDVLAIEKPYAGELSNASYQYNCHYCFKRCLTNLPCLICNWAIYCDETCRIKSYERDHKYDCEILTSFLKFSDKDTMYLSLKILLISIHEFGLDKYVANVRALNADITDPMMRGFNSDGKYLSDQMNSVYTLEGNEAKRSISDLFIRYCKAVTMISYLKLAGFIIPDHQLGTVGESLVHIICVVSSNAHEIIQPTRYKTWSFLNTSNSVPVGNVLLPVLSLLNHHCDPNVVRHNYNGTVVLRAIKHIVKDSQLYDNYGNLFAISTKEERQLKLYKQYFFRCQCEPCEENWPLYQDLTKQPISERIMLTNITPDILQKERNKLFTIISALRLKQYCLNDIQLLYSQLRFFHENVKTPCREFCECQEAIKEILLLTIDKFIV